LSRSHCRTCDGLQATLKGYDQFWVEAD
jgi:hypothetical protein